jgi:hypothetical protein
LYIAITSVKSVVKLIIQSELSKDSISKRYQVDEVNSVLIKAGVIVDHIRNRRIDEIQR